MRIELCAATEELELRGRLICELEQRVTELERESCTSMASGIVSNVVSEALFRSQQNSLAIAEEGVRDSESLQAQLAEMAEREWKICQSNAEIEKAKAELKQKQRDFEREAQRVEALEISVSARYVPRLTAYLKLRCCSARVETVGAETHSPREGGVGRV